MTSTFLWQIADDLRHTRDGVTLPGIVRIAKSRGIDVTINDIITLAPLLRLPGESLAPPILVDVCTAVAAKTQPKRILDPWAGFGALIIPVVNSTRPESAVAISRRPDEATIGASLFGGSNVTWHVGEPLAMLASDSSSYDLVVSCPPFGHLPHKPAPAINGIDVSDGYGNQIAAAALAKLSEKGLGVIVLSPSAITRLRPRGLVAYLKRAGLAIGALLHLPNGFFATTTMDAYVALISRGPQHKLFIGELRDLKIHNETVLRNLWARAAGEDLSLGALVEYADFRGYRQHESSLAIKRLSQRSGVDGVKLRDLAIEINFIRDPDPASFPESDNAIYLPLIGKSKALTAKTELTMKAHNYAQIVLDHEKALASYMSAYFSSPLGQLARKQILSDTVIPKITKQSLSEAVVYIPDIATQGRCLKSDSMATNLISEIESIRTSMWARPRTAKEAYLNLERLNKEDNLKVWIDSLPFPLASILWAYHASGDDDRERNEHLLHFFEALAEFHALVLWSAVKSAPGLMNHARYPLGKAKPLNYSLSNSSFGSWIEITARLAKFSRSLLNSSDESEVDSLLGAFRTRNADILRMLSSSKISDQLQNANTIRNKLRHGGILGKEAARELRIRLESLLANIRSEVANTWNEFPLMKAGHTLHSAGVFHYEAELIMGRSTPFERRRVDVTTPIDHENLFLLASDSSEPLVLEPLLIVAPSPQTAENACYFYNSAKAGQLRFVSYHFRGEPEIVRSDESAMRALELLVSITEEATSK